MASSPLATRSGVGGAGTAAAGAAAAGAPGAGAGTTPTNRSRRLAAALEDDALGPPPHPPRLPRPSSDAFHYSSSASQSDAAPDHRHHRNHQDRPTQDHQNRRDDYQDHHRQDYYQDQHYQDHQNHHNHHRRGHHQHDNTRRHTHDHHDHQRYHLQPHPHFQTTANNGDLSNPLPVTTDAAQRNRNQTQPNYSRTRAHTHAQTHSQSQSQSQSHSHSQSQPHPQSQSQPQPRPQPKSQSESQSHLPSHPRAQSKPRRSPSPSSRLHLHSHPYARPPVRHPDVHVRGHEALDFARIPPSSANSQILPQAQAPGANASMTSPTVAASTHLDFRKPTAGATTNTNTTATTANTTKSPSSSRKPALANDHATSAAVNNRISSSAAANNNSNNGNSGNSNNTSAAASSTSPASPFHSPSPTKLPTSLSSITTPTDATRPRPPLSSPLSHPFNHHASPLHHSSILSGPGLLSSSSALGSSSSSLPPPPPPTLAPPQGALGSIMSSSGLSATNGNGPSSASPLQPPKADFPRQMHEKSSGSFYDPLTDTTKERRPSESWQKQSRSDAYDYPPSKTESSRYYGSANKHSNGYSSSSPSANSKFPRSPHPHPHPKNGSDVNSTARMATPNSRHRNPPDSLLSTRSQASTPAPSLPSILNPEPRSTTPAASSNTSSRAAELMSFSNILSNADPLPKQKAPVMTETKKEKPPRKSKARESLLRDSEGGSRKDSRRASSAHVKEAPAKPPKRQVNGQPKPKPVSADKEKKIQHLLEQLDLKADDVELSELDIEEQFFAGRVKKRKLNQEQAEYQDRIMRRGDLSNLLSRKLIDHVGLAKRRYDEIHYDEALHEVREREIYAEKERKKDMQRKRRREKSMQVTIEQKEAALARALAAEDEAERAKHLREAERASKKAQQTRLILQKGIKGPARGLQALELNLEGGIMSSFPATDQESNGKAKAKGRSGARPKKSKEQKQAEKDAAEAAQAALDAGEELPAKEETKIRIKLSKAKDKEPKDRDKDKESKENAKEPKEKEKAVEEPPANPLETKFQSKGYNQIYDQIWRDLARKDVLKTFKLATDSYATKASNLKKTAILASKEAKRWQLRTNKGTKDLQARAKRCMRDMMGFWKRNEREERDMRKAAERQELENARKEEADREAARQKRKLNFLISQTELYSHFIGKKIKTDEVERSTDNPDIAPAANIPTSSKLDVAEPTGPIGNKVTDFNQLDFDAEDEETLRAAAVANAQNAIAEAQQKARAFNKTQDDMDEDGEMNFQNPTGLGDVTVEQPKLLNCQLKEYQLKGLNWLANLYEQGINGILADEMGLGKTVQSISVMAYLAEVHDIWGPYLVVAPASTLHNWQQEIAKFVPEFKVLPYWGTAGDRKVLRKFWDRKHNTYRKDAPFHVLVTSYQLVVSDVAYFQKMRWQYMILDEAQAIKSSQSSRWKCLLGFHCRNRLLLTGTPIQNNMQELWALLHFIMPSLFDSHDEFSEWFSKDIESHAQSNTTLNEDQLRRLHLILKPFMLRRVKKHVQKELGDKIELDVFCELTYRQRAYYRNLRNQISFMDLIEKATMGDDQDSGTLMNLVMQFRKVCNHPDLFQRADTTSPFSSSYFAETASFVREGNNVQVGYSTRSLIEYKLPRLVWAEGGRLYRAGKDNERAGFRNKYLNHLMNIWDPANVRASTSGNDAFSFLRFADASPQEVYQASRQDVFSRASDLVEKSDRLGHMQIIYDEPGEETYTPAHALFQIKARTDTKPLADITSEGVLSSLMNISNSRWHDSGLSRLEQAALPGATAPPVDIFCEGTRAPVIEREDTLFNLSMRKALHGPTSIEEKTLVERQVPLEQYPQRALLPVPDNEKRRFTNITVPSMRRFVTDSGKLAKLDQLLFKLKEEGHRVLLYFQMTRMIDLMEEYLTYRNYKYCRLDGSTKLEDRRDTVHDFQTRPDIFVFLLSTRAGGLGINLTSADTVIFYDSDWNPTIDSQAMDRAHRLGQTKQVTVYRLITRGTIEERIRKRAMQKEEVQRVVIQGGGARGVDFSGRRPAENRNRDIAMWLADDEQAELIEQREKELLESGELDKVTKKRGGNKRKREAVSLDDMYHEGEGHFNDENKPSGTATPVEPEAKAAKKRKGGSKKAKTTKQRLAIADGEMDI
ncbi:putative ino80-like protein [Rosellinia necatrix]|uniref:Chromatin-remodeling ATPase INO80 n=1 Tax=Rosellinia necatrix TaxID=77044 RepID=A0A1W2TX63_ROSNE|nr:putative ino80-like protein [Rosellinia necatrix]